MRRCKCAAIQGFPGIEKCDYWICGDRNIGDSGKFLNYETTPELARMLRLIFENIKHEF